MRDANLRSFNPDSYTNVFVTVIARLLHTYIIQHLHCEIVCFYYLRDVTLETIRAISVTLFPSSAATGRKQTARTTCLADCLGADTNRNVAFVYILFIFVKVITKP